MKRLFKFLANRKGSAFIETLMVYVCVALMGVAVVGVATKTIKDAAAGSPYQEELASNNENNPSGGSDSNANVLTAEIIGYSVITVRYEEGMTWGEWIESEYNDQRITIHPADWEGQDFYYIQFNSYGCLGCDPGGSPSIFTHDLIYSNMTYYFC